MPILENYTVGSKPQNEGAVRGLIRDEILPVLKPNNGSSHNGQFSESEVGKLRDFFKLDFFNFSARKTQGYSGFLLKNENYVIEVIKKSIEFAVQGKEQLLSIILDAGFIQKIPPTIIEYGFDRTHTINSSNCETFCGALSINAIQTFSDGLYERILEVPCFKYAILNNLVKFLKDKDVEGLGPVLVRRILSFPDLTHDQLENDLISSLAIVKQQILVKVETRRQAQEDERRQAQEDERRPQLEEQRLADLDNNNQSVELDMDAVRIANAENTMDAINALRTSLKNSIRLESGITLRDVLGKISTWDEGWSLDKFFQVLDMGLDLDLPWVGGQGEAELVVGQGLIGFFFSRLNSILYNADNRYNEVLENNAFKRFVTDERFSQLQRALLSSRELVEFLNRGIDRQNFKEVITFLGKLPDFSDVSQEHIHWPNVEDVYDRATLPKVVKNIADELKNKAFNVYEDAMETETAKKELQAFMKTPIVNFACSVDKDVESFFKETGELIAQSEKRNSEQENRNEFLDDTEEGFGEERVHSADELLPEPQMPIINLPPKTQIATSHERVIPPPREEVVPPTPSVKPQNQRVASSSRVPQEPGSTQRQTQPVREKSSSGATVVEPPYWKVVLLGIVLGLTVIFPIILLSKFIYNKYIQKKDEKVASPASDIQKQSFTDLYEEKIRKLVVLSDLKPAEEPHASTDVNNTQSQAPRP